MTQSSVDIPYFAGLLFIFGLVVWTTTKVLKGLWTCWIADALGFSYNWNVTKDSWAVITGATDGIGLEYAIQLGKKGFNLLLLSRSSQKLEEAQMKIRQEASKVGTILVVAVDFSKRDIYDKIAGEIGRLPTVEVLVNNVGVTYRTGEYFSQLEVTHDADVLDYLMAVNMDSCIKMTSICLPRMESQGKGAIINISSMAASYPVPLLSLYSACKSFVDMFSRSLSYELEEKGIIVQSVLPYFVATKMSRIRKPSFWQPSAKAFVEGALRTVGVEDRTFGYWTHKIKGFAESILLKMDLEWFVVKNFYLPKLKTFRTMYYRKYIDKKRD